MSSSSPKLDPASANAAALREITSWNGVTARPGPMRDGLELRFQGTALGHLHAPAEGEAVADVFFPPDLGERLIAEGQGQPHPIIPGLGWLSVPMGDDAQVARAVALFRRNYERVAVSGRH